MQSMLFVITSYFNDSDWYVESDEKSEHDDEEVFEQEENVKVYSRESG